MNWSGGKDSSLCLYEAVQNKIPVEKLVTTVNSIHNRISMHGVRRILLEQQAASIGLPLQTIKLPEQPGMLTYEQALSETHQSLKREGFTHAIYGDIFLEDLKQYREDVLKKDELEGIFPLWKKDSRKLMNQFISLGFKAYVVCVNTTYLDESFCGRLLDKSFITDLPANIDVCGENGEYHSFVFDGPIFSIPVNVIKGELIFKEYASPKNDEEECFNDVAQPPTGFYFCDLLPA